MCSGKKSLNQQLIDGILVQFCWILRDSEVPIALVRPSYVFGQRSGRLVDPWLTRS